MRQLRGFLPWIAYPLAALVLNWQTAALAALAVSIVTLAWSRITDAHTEAFGIAATVFFAALSVVAYADPTTGIHQYVAALTPAALAIAAIASIAIHRPFTIVFAQRVAPHEYWNTPIFMHINVVLSAVWATSFAAMAAVIATVITLHPSAGGIIIAAQVAGFLVPMRICRTYPASARDRYIASV